MPQRSEDIAFAPDNHEVGSNVAERAQPASVSALFGHLHGDGVN